MLTFKNFINEAASPYATKWDGEEAFIAWCEKNAPKFLATIARAPIFRGSDVPSGIINTSGMSRTSANTRNFYTVWIDGDPSWHLYPKRSKSLICGSDADYPSEFGDLKLVIPADNARVGITRAAAFDMWDAFRATLKKMEHRVHYNLEALINDLGTMIDLRGNHSAAHKLLARGSETDYDDLVAMLASLTAAEIEKMSVDPDVDADDRQILSIWSEYMVDYNWGDMHDALTELLDPETNGFRTSSAGRFAAIFSASSEVWVEGEVAMIDVEMLQSAHGGLSPLAQFVNKYRIDAVF